MKNKRVSLPFSALVPLDLFHVTRDQIGNLRKPHYVSPKKSVRLATEFRVLFPQPRAANEQMKMNVAQQRVSACVFCPCCSFHISVDPLMLLCPYFIVSRAFANGVSHAKENKIVFISVNESRKWYFAWLCTNGSRLGFMQLKRACWIQQAAE